MKLWICTFLLLLGLTTPSYATSDNLVWNLSDGILTISGTGEMPIFTSPEDQPWADVREEILEVRYASPGDISVPNMKYWFTDCVNLRKTEIPYTARVIGTDAFANCPNLTEILFYYYDTDDFVIIPGAFYVDSHVDTKILLISDQRLAVSKIQDYVWDDENRHTEYVDVYTSSLLDECWKCGHTIWAPYVDNGSGHQQTCQYCGDTQYYGHSSDGWTDSYTSDGPTQHACTDTCPDCGATTVTYETHFFGTGETCQYCGYVRQTTYTVTWNANGGLINSASSTTTTVPGGTTATPPGTPSRVGYTFRGWYTAVSEGSLFSTQTVTGNVTYYAQWKRDPAPLSDFVEGDIVYLNENGNPVAFYVAKHDYEPDLNGEGLTLLVRKDLYVTTWSHTDSGAKWGVYQEDYLTRLNYYTYIKILDEDVRNSIPNTKYKYFGILNGGINQKTASNQIFLLSSSEVGLSASDKGDGSLLPIADVLKVATYNGTASAWWTRTLSYDANYDTVNPLYVTSTGTLSNMFASNASGIRPCFTLPESTIVNGDGTISAPSVFSVTVPTSVPLTVAPSGAVTVADMQIVNASTGDVVVSSVTLSTLNGWQIVPFTTDMSVIKVDSKYVGFKLNDCVTTIENTQETFYPNWLVAEGSSFEVNYSATLPARSTTSTDETIMSIVYVIDWANP